jgi:hypothetical protein
LAWRTTEHVIESVVDVRASPARLWREVTEVDIAAFRHPLYLRVLGVPKPLSASVVVAGVGGARVARFSNGLRFSQVMTEWNPHESYAFTFSADPGFRVGWLLDLHAGFFQLRSGAYRLRQTSLGVQLTLATRYSLSGVAGLFLRLPVLLTLRLFQRYLLAGIRRNAERAASVEPERHA